MSQTIIHTKQAIVLQKDNKELHLAVGNHVLPDSVLRDFRETKFCKSLVDAGIVRFNVELDEDPVVKRQEANRRSIESRTLGPITLADWVPVQGSDFKQGPFVLRQADGLELTERYATKREAEKAMLDHNAKQWARWEAEQMPTKASKAAVGAGA